MNYDCILINGCSYSAPAAHRVYGDFLAEHFGAPLVNLALDGSSNQRLLRTSIEELTRLKKEYQNPLVVVGWTFIRRLEVWYQGTHQKLISQIPDHTDSRFVTLDWIIGYNEATVEQKAMFGSEASIHKLLMDFYTNLYMFAHTLESQNVDYCFFSGPNNSVYPVHSFPYINSMEQVQWIVNNPQIFNLDNFCISNWAKENDPECNQTGHLSENGHKKFAGLILDKLTD